MTPAVSGAPKDLAERTEVERGRKEGRREARGRGNEEKGEWERKGLSRVLM